MTHKHGGPLNEIHFLCSVSGESHDSLPAKIKRKQQQQKIVQLCVFFSGMSNIVRGSVSDPGI